MNSTSFVNSKTSYFYWNYTRTPFHKQNCFFRVVSSSVGRVFLIYSLAFSIIFMIATCKLKNNVRKIWGQNPMRPQVKTDLHV